MIEAALKPIMQATFFLQNGFDHEIVQATGNITPNMCMSETADLMNDSERVLIVQLLFRAEQAGGHDPHQAAVSIVPFIIASAL